MINTHHPIAKNKLADRLCGWLMGLPIFAELSGAGIKLPENHYLMDGIPLHSSMFALALLMFSHKFTKLQLVLTLLFIIYFITCFFQDFSRSILAIQSIYFLAFYFILRSLPLNRIETIAVSALKALMAFVILHFLSILFFAEGSVGSLFLNTTKFWNIYTIYQSHLTYPLVLIMGLWILNYSKSSFPNYQRLFFMIVAAIIIILLLRRTAFAIFLIFFMCYRPKTFLILSPIFISALVFILSGISDFTRLTNLERVATWSDSINIIMDLNSFILGNGLNNYSHNYFLHTLTTHGIIYSSVIFCALLLILLNFAQRVNYSVQPIILLFAFIIIDWNVNANLYQPYYAGMFALTLIIISSRFSIKDAPIKNSISS